MFSAIALLSKVSASVVVKSGLSEAAAAAKVEKEKKKQTQSLTL